jgi:hypothetical protein
LSGIVLVPVEKDNDEQDHVHNGVDLIAGIDQAVGMRGDHQQQIRSAVWTTRIALKKL